MATGKIYLPISGVKMVTPTATAATDVEFNVFTANWNAVTGAVSYRLDVSTSDTFTTFVTGYEDKTVSGTSDSVTGLDDNTTYYYRVRAVDSYDTTTANSNIISQTTNETSHYNEAYETYETYVNSDGGEIINENITADMFDFLSTNDLYDNLVLGVGSDFGIKKNVISEIDHIQKAYDLSENRNNAVQTTEANQPKLVADGMEFVNSNILDVDDDASITGTAPRTLMFWVNPNQVNNFQFLVSYGDDSTYKGFSVEIGSRTGGYTWNLNGHGAPAVVVSNHSVDFNEWQFVSYVYNGTDIYIYKNDLDGTEFLDRPYDTAYGNFVIGLRQYSTPFPFSGKINDIQLYNKALSAAEITNLYNNSKSKYGHE